MVIIHGHLYKRKNASADGRTVWWSVVIGWGEDFCRMKTQNSGGLCYLYNYFFYVIVGTCFTHGWVKIRREFKDPGKTLKKIPERTQHDEPKLTLLCDEKRGH